MQDVRQCAVSYPSYAQLAVALGVQILHFNLALCKCGCSKLKHSVFQDVCVHGHVY